MAEDDLKLSAEYRMSLRGWKERCPTCHRRLFMCFCDWPPAPTFEEERQIALWGAEIEHAAFERHVQQCREAGGKVRF
jgi:hypothetical protein